MSRMTKKQERIRAALARATVAILDEFSDCDLLLTDDFWSKEVTLTAGDARRVVSAFAETVGMGGKFAIAKALAEENDSKSFDRMQEIKTEAERIFEESKR